MIKFFAKNLSIISFLLIPILNYFAPNWLIFLGSHPYWPLFWLLPWSMMHGSLHGLIVGFSLGITLDAIGPDISYTQIPGLALCGLWFGRFKTCSNFFVGHFRYGLICSIGTLLCGLIYFLQILINNFPNNSFIFYFPSIQNILAQLFVTGLFAPLFCSWLWRLFKSSKDKNFIHF